MNYVHSTTVHCISRTTRHGTALIRRNHSHGTARHGTAPVRRNHRHGTAERPLSLSKHHSTSQTTTCSPYLSPRHHTASKRVMDCRPALPNTLIPPRCARATSQLPISILQQTDQCSDGVRAPIDHYVQRSTNIRSIRDLLGQPVTDGINMAQIPLSSEGHEKSHTQRTTVP